ncbi:hypothetical protein FRC07_002348 [Ceratobasidium sp. 392]|nr:hypothetical protein FRC07_002348 [Ceratobasidium sp. 392]
MSPFNNPPPHGPTTRSRCGSILASSEASSDFETKSGCSDDDRPVLDAATLLLILQSPRIFPLDLSQGSDFGLDADDELSAPHGMPSDFSLNDGLESPPHNENFQAGRLPRYEEIVNALSSSDQGDQDNQDDQDSQDNQDNQGDQDDQGDQLDDSDSESCMSPDVLTEVDETRDLTPFDLYDDYRSLGFKKSHTPAPIDTQNLTNSEPLYNTEGLATTCSPSAPSRASGALVLRFNSPSARHHPYGRSKKLAY